MDVILVHSRTPIVAEGIRFSTPPLGAWALWERRPVPEGFVAPGACRERAASAGEQDARRLEVEGGHPER